MAGVVVFDDGTTHEFAVATSLAGYSALKAAMLADHSARAPHGGPELVAHAGTHATED